jgi:hypothetical protein
MNRSRILSAVFFLCLLPVLGFTAQRWIPEGFEGTVDPLNYQLEKRELSFEMRVPVHAKCSFPIFSGEGTLIELTNAQLKESAEARFENFVQGGFFSEDQWEDGYTLNYELFPIYQTTDLISIYGYDFQGRGDHACTYYEGKTFWQIGNTVIKLDLDDLFVEGSGYREFLLQYCENNFKAAGYGYYAAENEFVPELGPDDLNTFVLTPQGLLIIFRAYTVRAWADASDTVLIPYTSLKEYIDPSGPLRTLL